MNQIIPNDDLHKLIEYLMCVPNFTRISATDQISHIAAAAVSVSIHPEKQRQFAQEIYITIKNKMHAFIQKTLTNIKQNIEHNNNKQLRPFLIKEQDKHITQNNIGNFFKRNKQKENYQKQFSSPNENKRAIIELFRKYTNINISPKHFKSTSKIKREIKKQDFFEDLLKRLLIFRTQDKTNCIFAKYYNQTQFKIANFINETSLPERLALLIISTIGNHNKSMYNNKGWGIKKFNKYLWSNSEGLLKIRDKIKTLIPILFSKESYSWGFYNRHMFGTKMPAVNMSQNASNDWFTLYKSVFIENKNENETKEYEWLRRLIHRQQPTGVIKLWKKHLLDIYNKKIAPTHALKQEFANFVLQTHTNNINLEPILQFDEIHNGTPINFDHII